ncbi:MAG: hypothetical protein QMC67_13225 [Candidatus Wallbacteria bacterium]
MSKYGEIRDAVSLMGFCDSTGKRISAESGSTLNFSTEKTSIDKTSARTDTTKGWVFGTTETIKLQ